MIGFTADEAAVGQEEDFSILQLSSRAEPDLWLTVMLPPGDEGEAEPGDLYVELCNQGSSAHDATISRFVLTPNTLTIHMREGSALVVPAALTGRTSAKTVRAIRVAFSADAATVQRMRDFLERVPRYGSALEFQE